MTRTSFTTLTLLVSLVALAAAPACSSDSPDTGGSGGTSSTPVAGSANNTAGTGVLNTAGTASGGASGTTAGTSSGGAATAGTAGTTSTGGASGGASTAGNGGNAAGSGGSAAGNTTGGSGGSGGGGSNPACPEKIDSKVACTQVISCPDATCGVFKLGAKDCSCPAASGTFMCTSCDYAGRTEEIVQPPASALPACAADDTTLEKNTPNCTKGMRCKSLDMTKSRFCACWDDPVDGGTVWDCDAMPSNWPK